VKPVVVLDTNILLDILVFDDERAHPLRAALANQELDAVATKNTIEEFADVISRPQFDLDEETQKETILQWQSWSRVIDDLDLQVAPWKCKDRDDQVFINLAFTLKPSTLISKDKLVLKIAKRAQKEQVTITSDHNQFLLAKN
jgi:putative PIN family toxin of toxin-antitoxin system